jgi:hypothetical protein
VAESRLNLTKYIPTLCDTYSQISFDGVSEAHQCDLVWAYQDLEAYRVEELDIDIEEAPSFHKVLYWLDRAIREGQDQHLTERWCQEDIDSFWQQLVSGKDGVYETISDISHLLPGLAASLAII